MPGASNNPMGRRGWLRIVSRPAAAGGEASSVTQAEHRLAATRNILLIGFGVLLGLLALCGLNAVHVVYRLQTSNETIFRRFLRQQSQLDEIRSAIYLSGTYVRDYLLEPDPKSALLSLKRLQRERARSDSILSGVPQNGQIYQELRRQIDQYWRVLDPVLSWAPEQRSRKGYRFLRDDLLPRRSSALGIADTIASANQQRLLERDGRLLALFSNFRSELILALLVMILFGVVQAVASTIHSLRLERKTVSHLIDVTEARHQLKQLSAKLVTSQEDERKNLSRELHDAVGQSLSAVQFELHDLAVRLTPYPVQLRVHIDRIRELVESSLGMVRNMARLLRPAMLDDLGLAAALEWQARELSRSTGVPIRVQADSLTSALPDKHKTCLFRIIQEALNNICRHANASAVEISLHASPTELTAAIRDDGCGFQPGKAHGLGLIGMQERVENLCGKLSIRSQPGKGTQIEAVLPLPQTLRNSHKSGVLETADLSNPWIHQRNS